MDDEKEPERTGDEVCCTCGCKENLEWGPDPFYSEIAGDDTPVWECRDCRYESAMEI